MLRSRLLAAVLSVFVLGACSGDDDGDPSGPSGGNLRFTINGSTVAVDATWRALPNNRHRIEWQQGTGASYSNIEIDIWGNTPGVYTVKASPGAAGDAGFQYLVPAGGTTTNYAGTAGSITVTSFANDRFSGTFALTTTAGGTSYPVTAGTFTNVPKQ